MQAESFSFKPNQQIKPLFVLNIENHVLGLREKA